MYLVAQRVRSKTGIEGVNAALYLHGHESADLWVNPSVQEVAYHRPGRRVAESVEVAPGGNAVEAYLDLVGPDDTSESTIVRVLEEFELRLGEPTPITAQVGSVAVQFSQELRERTPRVEQFRALRAAALALLSRRNEAVHSGEPLTVLVAHDSERWRFRLDARSEARVRRLAIETPLPGEVSIPFEVADDFRLAHGELYPHVAEWLTNLSKQQLLEIGGVRFADGEKTVWEWPRRRHGGS